MKHTTNQKHMKHVRFGSVLLLLALPASGSVLFSDRFSYPNGPLTQAPGSAWVTHGGTAHQLKVVDGKARLTQLDSEDINAPLSGGPYNQGVLYASLTVNVSSPPSGDGGFFFHFKDGGSTQKSRVFVSTNGVPSGSVKFGIANGSADAIYTTEAFAIGTVHRLVIRYQAGSPTSSTLWINPVNETETVRRVEATDVNRAAGISAVALRQALSSGDGIGTLLLDDLIVGTEFGDVAGVNTPPTISRISDQSTGANQPIGPISFRVEDTESDPSQLRVSLSSSNPELLGGKGVTFQGSGNDRSLRMVPNLNAQGTAEITVTVSDGTKSSSAIFRVTVGAPSLSGPERTEIPMDGESGALEFQVSDRESAAQRLTVSAFSSNLKLFPLEGIHWSGQSTTRLLSLKPAAGLSGTSVITVLLTDGTHTVSNRLSVTVFPQLGEVLSDPFDEPDGSLIHSPGDWIIHAPDGGSPTNILVQSGHLRLSETKAEDVSVPLRGAPYAEDAGTILYAALRVRCLDLPSVAGAFFGHFRDDRSGFRGRLYVGTRDAAVGRCRFGVASSSETPSYVPTDVGVGEDVLLVLKQNLSSGRAQLWVNPITESDPSVLASEEAAPIAVRYWSFRQVDGIGELWIDQIRVASSFEEALAMSANDGLKLTFTVANAGLGLSWSATPGTRLEHRESFGAERWSPMLLVPREENGRRFLTVPLTRPTSFYRVVRQ